jgi:hypothetical protein
VTFAYPARRAPRPTRMMIGMTEQKSPESSGLAATLAQQFPSVPMQSVVQCVWDAHSAVEYAGVDEGDRGSLVERLARAHLEELAGFYDSTIDS